jgi:hypothetical protein
MQAPRVAEWDVFTNYCKLVIGWWYVLIPGVLMSVIDIIERQRDKTLPIQPRWVWRSLVCGLVLAQFLVYREAEAQHQADVATLSARITVLEQQRPRLVGSIEQTYQGDASGSDKNMYPGLVVLDVRIRNLGTPSIAEAWHLLIRAANGKEEMDDAWMLPPKLWFTKLDERDRKLHVFRDFDKDALYNKALTPIPTGGEVVGKLVFRTRLLTAEEINVRGTRLTLTFFDAYGNSYSAEFGMSGLSQDMLYIPGLQNPH